MKVLILGAYGSLAQVATRRFLETTDAELTLFLRCPQRLGKMDDGRVRIVEGDVSDRQALRAAMVGQEVVYANLAGNMAALARAIVETMKEVGLRRLIFISSMGIYDEVPGQQYRSVLDPYRDSAAVVEASGLDYTVVRPAWFTNDNDTNYETTQKGQPFRGSVVSRLSVADLIVRLAQDPSLHVKKSVGINRL